MASAFHVFGPAHILVLVLVPVLAAALAAVHRRFPRESKLIPYSLAILLLLCAVSYYGSFVLHGEPIFPHHVPLELCDISLWVMIFTLFWMKAAVFDLAYYWAIAGAGMALLTPNLVRPSLFIEVQFFADHGLIVTAVLYLVWSGQARPRPGSVLRAMLALNIVALFVGTFDYLFKTDYMFLCTKPPTASLLDVFGPWPWYIGGCEVAGLVLFALLYLPFRRKRGGDDAAESDREKPRVEASVSP
jgi:hypothetical integral membrane protein (TIGR02206 family)